jgi:hypothetical protein
VACHVSVCHCVCVCGVGTHSHFEAGLFCFLFRPSASKGDTLGHSFGE